MITNMVTNKVINKVETKSLIIKCTYMQDGTVQANGNYLGRDDTLKQYIHDGCPTVHERNIQRMQNAGYEFLHVKYTDHLSKAIKYIV